MIAQTLRTRLQGQPRTGPARAARRRRRPITVRRLRRRPNPRIVLALVAVLGLMLLAWLWLRDSSLVAVRRVRVIGVSGPDAAKIRRALSSAARDMTTLDVRESALHTAVAPYPIVKSLRVSTQFPHGLTIHVTEEIPVATVEIAGRQVEVASDGTLVHDASPGAQLPQIPLPVIPGGTRLSDPNEVAAATLLGAAPYRLLSRISSASDTAAHGLIAQLRSGPQIYFGDTTRLGAKWAAALAVLASGLSAGAQYIDVSDPGRPAAGAQPTAQPGSTSTSVAPGPSAPAGQTTTTTAGTVTTPTGG